MEDRQDAFEMPSLYPAKLPNVLVRGSGDIGSAVAHCLFQAGYTLVVHEIPQPTTTRRKMAFTDAVFDGCALLAGVEAKRVDDLTLLPDLLAARQIIPLVVLDLSLLLETIQPEILIDARMRKHHQPEVQLGLAKLTIGLGPNFVAGETTAWVVETSWGNDLGRVFQQGATQPLAGEPRPISGYGRDRYVYAPQAGIFHTTFQIGDLVNADQIIAWIDTTPLVSPLTGALRGLTRDGVPVMTKTKVIEIDPRGSAAVVSGIGERPAQIAAGILAALQCRANSSNSSCS